LSQCHTECWSATPFLEYVGQCICVDVRTTIAINTTSLATPSTAPLMAWSIHITMKFAKSYEPLPQRYSSYQIEPALSTTPASTIPTGHHIHDDTTATTIDPPAETPTPATTANNNHECSVITIHGLFECGNNGTVAVKIANLDSTLYGSQDPEKVLIQQEKAKRKRYQDICETR
jgi:hypothetical protein